MASEPTWPLLLRVVWNAWNLAPSFVLRRIYPPRVVADNFNVDLDATNGSELRFGGSIPSYRLRLRYFNWNPFPVVVERVDFDVWFGQPTIQRQQWQQCVVPPYRSVPSIYYGPHQRPYEPGGHFEFQLDANQTRYIESQMAERRLKSDVVLHVEVYGTALGREFVKAAQRIHIPRHEVGGQG